VYVRTYSMYPTRVPAGTVPFSILNE